MRAQEIVVVVCKTEAKVRVFLMVAVAVLSTDVHKFMYKLARLLRVRVAEKITSTDTGISIPNAETPHMLCIQDSAAGYPDKNARVLAVIVPQPLVYGTLGDLNRLKSAVRVFPPSTPHLRIYRQYLASRTNIRHVLARSHFLATIFKLRRH